MRTFFGAAILLLAAATMVVAQEASSVKYSGYVVDQMCAKGMAKKANAQEKAAAHTRQCALETDCAASGYGIFSGGKYYTFDEKGSALAKSLIEKSKREKGLYFEAVGKLADGKLVLATLKEATPASTAKPEPKS